MTTAVLYTVDTELSPGLHRRGVSPDENMRIGVMGQGSDGEWGIAHQIRKLNEHRLKGVFFVEALCASVVGNDILKRVVDPILAGGHEVQLHIHTEWLRWAQTNIADGTQGENIADFDLPTQARLLAFGTEALQRAGAPAPIAFRAGNYGANDNTLRALARVGIKYDASHNQAYLGDTCRLSGPGPLYAPREIEGVTEVPITFFEDYPGHARPLQLCAVSAGEMRWALMESIQQERPTAVVVSHSFELLNATRTRGNPLLVRRFDAFCDLMSEMKAGARSSGFADLSLEDAPHAHATLKSNSLRTTRRVVEQVFGRLAYDRG